MASKGYKVGVVDTDIQSPGIHVILGLAEEDMHHTLNDYLWGKCDIEEATHDVSANLGITEGQLLFVPSSIKPGEIARVLREGYDVGLLNDGFQSLIDALDLDVLLIDTHPGMNEETLLSIAISDALVIVMRPDQQDFQGTAVTVDVGRKLDVPDLVLLVNKTPQVYDMDDIKARVESIYNSEVAAVLPHSDELMALASEGVFVVKFPDHEIAQKYRTVAERLLRD
jgi:MinD-like ATPase involved in chromosome partitioning or flagellar assembly